MIALSKWQTLAGFAAPICTGLLLVGCFPPYNLVPLVWISLIPLAFCLRSKAPPLPIYLGCFLGALVFYMVGLDWMRTSDGGTGLSGERALSWVFTCEVAAVSFVASVGLARSIARQSTACMTLLLPVLWLVIQYLAFLAGTLTTGTPFPWLQLGLPAIELRQVSQIADIGGIWLLTALIALVNGAIFDATAGIYHWAKNRTFSFRAIILPPICASLLVGMSWAYGEGRLRSTDVEPGPTVCLMPPASVPTINLADDSARNPKPAIPEESEPDILLWAEGAFGQPLLDVARSGMPTELSKALRSDQIIDGSEQRTLEMVAKESSAVVFIGSSRIVDTGRGYENRNCLACIDPVDGYVGAYDKHYLVPWSEYGPLAWLLGDAPEEYAPGASYPVFLCRNRRTGREFRCCGAICYDTAYSQPFRAAMLTNSDSVPSFFVVAANESFDDTGRLQQCMLQHLRFRAIENRRAIVRNVSGGPSGIINSVGEYVTPWVSWRLSTPVMLPPIPVDARSTLYTRIGDWTAYVLCLVFAVRRILPQSVQSTTSTPSASKASVGAIPSSRDALV